MKPFVQILIVPTVGLALGAAGAFAAHAVMDERTSPASPAAAFVPAGPILVPLVLPDGRLSAYVSLTTQIQVPVAAQDRVRGDMPLLLDAVTMRACHTPLASGTDGQIPRVEAFRKLVFDAAVATFGRANVRRVAVTQVQPV